MDISVTVEGQNMTTSYSQMSLALHSQQFVRFAFTLSSEWDNLTVFAQFIQDGVAYNQYLDSDNCAYLPSEIVKGYCYLMLYGTGSSVIGTTNSLLLTVHENHYIEDAQSTVISESLYQQLVDRVASAMTSFETLTRNVATAETNLSNANDDIDDINDDITAINTTVSSHTSSISTLQTNLSTAQTKINTNTSSITTLQTRITETQSDITDLDDLVTDRTAIVDEDDNDTVYTATNHVVDGRLVVTYTAV